MDLILHSLSLYLVSADVSGGLVSDVFFLMMRVSHFSKVGCGKKLYAASYAIKFIISVAMVATDVFQIN
jgi:hypothetical protein